jgi:signal transduction histidine kinase
LENIWNKLKKALARQLKTGEKLDKARLTEITALLHQIRELVPSIQKRLNTLYQTDAAAAIAQFIQQAKYSSIRFAATPNLPAAQITPADLIYVLDELVQNALRHIEGHPAQINITLQRSLDELHLDVRDNGRGIPENLWEEIFRLGFTTKPGGAGGFGLYHARQRLAKYGGKIFVAASEMGKSTTMRICLKIAKP